MQRIRCHLAAATIALVSLVTPAMAATDLTACGQTVRGDAYLTADLDCTGSDTAVELKGAATLNLNGFSIRNYRYIGVACNGRCAIVGPGSLDGPGDAVYGIRRIQLVDVTIEQGWTAVYGWRIQLENSSISNTKYGVYGTGKVKLVNSTITGAEQFGVMYQNAIGECRGKLVLENSVVVGNGFSSDCTSGPGCADVMSCNAPLVDETSSCGTSSNYADTATWGVCSDD